MSKPFRLPNANEQAVLHALEVRLITADERPRWDQEVSQHHYLKNAILVGQHLCYVATYQGQWLACLGWSAPARHLKARDQWVGWTAAQLACRRHFLANNARYCILVDRLQVPNLAARALGLCCQRLSADWLAQWGHPIIAVESFVDAQLFRGTAYKAGGWLMLGPTSGYGRVAEDYYEPHERPKQLWVRALDRQLFARLKAPTLPPALADYQAQPPAKPKRLATSPRKIESLLDRLPEVPDPRDPHGRYHPWRAVLGIIILAKLAGTHMGQRHVAEFALTLTRPQRRALRCLPDANEPTGYLVPAESTYQRALAGLDFDALQPLLIAWQKATLPPDTDRLIAIDGKAMRGTDGRALVGAVGQPSQRIHAVVPMQKHDSEIMVVRSLLRQTEFTGRLLTLDALHTQHETAHQILYDHGADYLVPLRDNQPGLVQTAQTLLPEGFSPCSGGGPAPALPGGADRGHLQWPPGKTHADGPRRDTRADGPGGRGSIRPAHPRTHRKRKNHDHSPLHGHQPSDRTS